jgi:purine-nucleoside phosphorylase
MDVQKTISFLKKRIGFTPDAVLLTGSGQSGFSSMLSNVQKLPYAKIPGFPRSRVSGHANTLFWGEVSGRKVLLFSGRFHMYEGWSAIQAALPARVAAGLGTGIFLVTNAAGGIREDLVPGRLMLLSDHINLSGANPLTGYKGPLALFPSMTDAYDPRLRGYFHQSAKALGIGLTEGVYACCSGPSYETPAEIRMLKHIGADAVGMSTVPEVIVARQEGLATAGLSLITNKAAGLSDTAPRHEEVLATAKRAEEDMKRLIAGFLAGWTAGK